MKIDLDNLSALTAAERAALSRRLADLDDLAASPTSPVVRSAGYLVLVAATVGALVLVPWTVRMSMILPRVHTVLRWRGVWVGFDCALVAALGASAWYGWRRRQLVVACLLVSATLLLCDAWFDVTLSWGGKDQWAAILSALVLELPTAAGLAWVAYRLLKRTSLVAWHHLGGAGNPPSLRALRLTSPESQPAPDLFDAVRSIDPERPEDPGPTARR